MPSLSVTVKLVSGPCNGDCSYCRVRDSGNVGASERMDAVILEGFLPELAAYVADVGHATLIWSGAEPTLASLGFMQWIAELQDRLAHPAVRWLDILETNGLLLDAAWTDFLARRGFLVRLAVDGPGRLHDQARRTDRGEASFAQVRRAIDRLVTAGVEVSASCVVGPHNVDHAREVMGFFVDSGVSYLDFVPALDQPASAPTGPARYLVTPEGFGGFLIQAFETWWDRGRPQLSVRPFDHLIQAQVGADTAPCAHGLRCEGPLVLDTDGSLYPCEHYVHPGWRLGNVREMPLHALVESPERVAFRAQKRPLPEACRECTWSGLCNGGCFRNRLLGWDGSESPDLFCEGYRRLLSFVDAHLAIVE